MKTVIKLLLVEDDSNLCYILKSGLEDMIGGYEVTTAANGEEGLKRWRENRPDFIITDVEMPVMNGFDMVNKIREIDGDTPILFASGMIAAKNVTRGFKLGANNYVKKPFIPEELDAHIRSILEMKEGARSKNETDTFKIGSYTFNAGHALLINENGKKKTLTAREGGILKMLCENKNEVVKREAILRQFWQTEDDYFASRSLDVFINNLRKKFADDPAIEIKVHKGVGLTLATE